MTLSPGCRSAVIHRESSARSWNPPRSSEFFGFTGRKNGALLAPIFSPYLRRVLSVLETNAASITTIVRRRSCSHGYRRLAQKKEARKDTTHKKKCAQKKCGKTQLMCPLSLSSLSSLSITLPSDRRVEQNQYTTHNRTEMDSSLSVENSS